MKKHFVCIVLVCVMVLFGAGLSQAGNVNGNGNGSGSGNGAGDGTGPIHDIFSGEYFEYSGMIEDCSTAGKLTLVYKDNSGTEVSVELYGIGPVYYWDTLGLNHPAAGENISVTGYNVDGKNIVTTITFEDGTIVSLRDEDGNPKWRGMKGKSVAYGRS